MKLDKGSERNTMVRHFQRFWQCLALEPVLAIMNPHSFARTYNEGITACTVGTPSFLCTTHKHSPRHTHTHMYTNLCTHTCLKSHKPWEGGGQYCSNLSARDEWRLKAKMMQKTVNQTPTQVAVEMTRGAHLSPLLFSPVNSPSVLIFIKPWGSCLAVTFLSILSYTFFWSSVWSRDVEFGKGQITF